VAGALIGGFVGALWGEGEARQETGIEKNGGAENFDTSGSIHTGFFANSTTQVRISSD
jgi:hypothetical protein